MICALARWRQSVPRKVFPLLAGPIMATMDADHSGHESISLRAERLDSETRKFSLLNCDSKQRGKAF